MIETAKCKICNNKIDPDEYFTNKTKVIIHVLKNVQIKLKMKTYIMSNIVLLITNANN